MLKLVRDIINEINENGEQTEQILELWAESIIDKCARIADEWENSGELALTIRTELKAEII